MRSLVPCTECARHVRASESTCPFCGAEIAAVAPRELSPMPADRLLARAAITFAAAAATAVTACGKTDVPPQPPPVDNPNNNVAPAYGVPVIMVDGSAVEQPPTPVPPPVADGGPTKPVLKK